MTFFLAIHFFRCVVLMFWYGIFSFILMMINVFDVSVLGVIVFHQHIQPS